MAKVQFKGIEDLTKQEIFQLNKIVNDYYLKIKRDIKDDFSIELKLKQYGNVGKKDKQHKHSMNLNLITSTKKFSTDAAEWDFNKALHSVFNKLLNEIEHKFRVSEQGKR